MSRPIHIIWMGDGAQPILEDWAYFTPFFHLYAVLVWRRQMWVKYNKTYNIIFQ